MALSDDFSPVWNAGAGDFTAVDDATANYGDAWLELSASSADVRAFEWTEFGDASDVEILGLARVPSFGDNEGYCRLHVRGAGTPPDWEGYFVTISSPEIRVEKYDGGTRSELFGTGTAPPENTWIWLRLRVEDGAGDDNTVKMRTWEFGDAEPSAWDYDALDANSGVPDSGWVGPGGFPDETQQWDWLAAARNGNTAPKPDTLPVSASPDGAISVAAVTPDADASTTSAVASPDGPITVSAVTPDAGAGTGANSEPVRGGAVRGGAVRGGTSPNVAASPDGPITVSAVTPDADASTFIEFTTNLPDVSGLALDASVEDEITASWDDVINYGDYRVEYRASVETDWTLHGTVDEATTSATITGLSDGEQYEVRVRSETEHVIGAYQTKTATTVLPAPSNIGTTNVSATAWTITWTDESDNPNSEDYVVQRRRQYADGFGPWESLATLSRNSTEYTDSTVVPDTTYEYRIRVRTDFDTAATTAQFTTPGLGYGTDRVAPEGWTVEVDRSDTGATRRPAIVGEPRYDPSLNSLPEVRLPVAKDDAWSQPQWEDAPIRVWRDGERLPIEQVAAVEQQPGQTVLTALGGTELLEPQSHEFDNSDVHAAANAVIDTTSYAKVVDSPSVTGGSLLQAVDTPTEFTDLYEDPGPQTPVIIDDTGTVPGETGLTLAQTCFLEEAEAYESGSTHSSDSPSGSPPGWSNDEAVGVPTDSSDVSITFTLDYEIPAGEVGVALHREYYDFDGVWSVSLDGQKIQELDATGSQTDTETTWNDVNTGTLGTEWTAALSAGEHTLTVETSNVANGALYVDIAAVFDERYHTLSNFDELSGGDSYMEAPALYPTGGTDAVLLYNGFQSASGATIDNTTWTDTSGDQAMALSVDGGSTYPVSCTNCDSLDGDFQSSGADITIKVTLDAYGDRDAAGERASPLFDYQAQTLRAFDLSGDIRDSAPLQDAVYNTEGRAILTDLADRGNALWAVTDDDTTGLTVEFTNAGQRTSTETLDLVDYAWSKQTLDRQVRWAIIRGGAQPVTGETFTADAGASVALDESNLVPSREQVFTTDRSQRFTRGTDYTMSYEAGAITVTTSGNMSDSTDYLIDYEHKPRGEFAEVTDAKKKIERTVVDATTDAICKGIANYLVDELGDPVRSGEAVISELPPGVSVLDALALDPVPETDTYHVTGIDRRPGEVRLDLATRESISDVVDDVRSRLADASERV